MMKLSLFKKHKSFKPQKFRISRTLFMSIAIIILIGLLGSTTLYLYRSVYIPFRSVDIAIQLQNILSPESFDIKDFWAAIKNMEKKQDQSNIVNWSQTPNIFQKYRSLPTEEADRESDSVNIPSSPDVNPQ